MHYYSLMSILSQNEGMTLQHDLCLAFRRCDMSAALTGIGLNVARGAVTDNHHWFDGPAGRVSRARNGAVVEFDAHPITVAVSFATLPKAQHGTAEISLANSSAGPLYAHRVILEFDVSLRTAEQVPKDKITWFRNGWQSWSFAGALSADEPDFSRPGLPFAYRIKEDPLVPRRQAPYVSDMVTAIRLADNAMLAGALRQQFFQRVHIKPLDDRVLLRLEIDLDGCLLSPESRVVVGGWQFEGERTSTVLMRRWGQRVGGRRTPHRRLSGWCSWYDRYRRITSGYIDSIADRLLGEERLAVLDTLLIDDGYQDKVGDWLVPAKRFGEPITDTGARLASRGLVPGIWVAPFIAQSGARIIKDHPDWLARCNGR